MQPTLGWRMLLCWGLSGMACAAELPTKPMEIHSRISGNANQVALTLDVCSGAFDSDLLNFLLRNRIPATVFATKRWLDKNPQGVALLKANLDLFDVEDHGEKHIPAVIGKRKKVYGITGQPDIVALRREVQGGADAVEKYIGVAPQWYRGATAEYDQQASDEIRRMGFKIAGFSVNADAGATLKRAQIAQRVRRVQGGDVIIAHMNKPASDTAEGLSDGLLDVLRRGLVFVRLDQVELMQVKPAGR